MKVVIEKPWEYTLYRSKDKHYKLVVLCGTSAMYDVEIYLNNEELTLYDEYGDEYIDKLAKSIMYNPKPWLNRNTPPK